MLFPLTPLESELESEPRKLPVPVITCQLPTLNEDEDSCLWRSLDAIGTDTGEVRLLIGDRANGVPQSMVFMTSFLKLNKSNLIIINVKSLLKQVFYVIFLKFPLLMIFLTIKNKYW